ncbi:unnamed protein product [Cuscuta campestris]|uniref:Uncharacterized protein n=2 Tax=Cuscuta sect. Cleistogrammica TaxID=1824901 RepID=A0A484N8P9_9ASTE|nr:hypothetical protein DM860_014930 [Cuscuta australis]VFQ97259.1 unnamed protein product [Cuscuta campestris]
MDSVKQKVSNTASVAKQHLDILAAKSDEKVEKARARTEEEKEIAEERRKAKEAEAKMKLHEAKARHATEKLQAKQAHLPPPAASAATHHHTHGGGVLGGHGHQETAVDAVVPPAGSAAPSYPLGGHTHGYTTRNI